MSNAPAAIPPTEFEALETLLGHAFADRALLTGALTHSSLGGSRRGADHGFDRLEFLGDRVLALVVADLLVATFPRADEGELGQRFAVLVSEPSLAEIAQEIELGRFLRLATSEELANNRRNPAVLADGFEALLGALFRDGGFAVAERFLRACFQPRVWAMVAPPREPKTTLQEWAQARGLPLPVYRLIASEGPAHHPHFVIEVEVGGHRARGEGAAKRIAERAAATSLLVILEKP